MVINVLSNRETERAVVRCSNGRQLAGLMFLLMVLGIIVWGYWKIVAWMEDADRVPLSQFMVTGDHHCTTNEDIRQSILALGQPASFMRLDVNEIQQQLERLPWIKQVSVRKQWPDELKIHLVEYVPVARWNDLNMLDSSGKAFSVPVEHVGKQSMPMLYGPDGSEKDVLACYRIFNEVLSSAKFQLKAVCMSARYSWQLMLQNNIRLELGRYDKVRRLQRFIEIYPFLLQQAWNDNKRISYVDLRYDLGLAVGWASVFIEPKTEKQ
ncbi:MAG: cell division protein FtsQ [Sodalis sp. Fse]|nr:MAG: cell division protein FtsQ [Sodalis sp. Fse]UVK78687.1 MAG: cell division protein FtsQ [Sodalis sp. Ffu]